MALVEADISMSVDGFATGPDLDAFPGLGKGGEQLHAWLDEREGARLSEATFAASGAFVTSRRVFDDTGGWAGHAKFWEEPAYAGYYGMPVFVVTHRAHEPVRTRATTFTFITAGVAETLKAAAAAAGDKRVHIMGGASLVQQSLRTGLVERLRLHIAPVLLGSGTALFDGAPGPDLHHLDTVDTPGATHVTYRVGRLSPPGGR
ncbi:dihydrofolate reductase family protein [Dactylosporangium sp. CS-033363]|uniref:dihydrofolate reductase family protein n=1 Tax=Dactylosporangium sp. CS-033363 TaxID=3239935 RepID=UPI003D90A056